MASQESHESEIVAVTGASGFIGSHIIKILLEQGYTVRGCVRDAASDKSAFLRALPHAERLSLFSADLTVEGSFDTAFSGVVAVIHTAAAVILTAPATDPQRQIVDVTVNGALNVLRSCEKAARAGTLRRFISTSSIAAIMDTSRPKGHVYTEDDTNMTATLSNDPYSLSKRLEEEAIDHFVAGLAPEAKFTYAYINPGADLPAKLVSGWTNLIARFDLMTGKAPMIPDLGFPSVDVRDVALAHVLALQRSAVQGRHICVESSVHMKQLAQAGHAAFPKMRECNSAKLTTALGMQLRSVVGDSVAATCQSFLDVGAVPAKP